jgi:transposase
MPRRAHARSGDEGSAQDASAAAQLPAAARPRVPRLVEGGLPTEALVADVLVSKYADHLPLYRQAQILAREGVAIDRSTLAHWVGSAAEEMHFIRLA